MGQEEASLSVSPVVRGWLIVIGIIAVVLSLPVYASVSLGYTETKGPFKNWTRIKNALGDKITEVRESKVLTDSPCRLVSPDNAADRDMQRVKRMLGEAYEIPKKIMEINRGHTLMADLAALAQSGANDGLLDACILQLYESALLVEGLLRNPADMAPRIQVLMEAAVKSK